jgi:hypothetical protein
MRQEAIKPEQRIDMSETKKVVFEIRVYVFGIKRKCRKADRHSFNLGSIDYNDGAFNRDEIEQKARDVVATNMKELIGDKIQVQLLRMEIGEHFRSFEMFDKRHVNFNLPITQLVGALS